MRPNANVRSALNEMEEIICGPKGRPERGLKTTAPQARANWADWSGIGWSAGSGSGRSSGIACPTETVALSTAEQRQRDLFAQQWALHDAKIEEARLALRCAQRLADSATNTVARDKAAEGCRLCDRVRLDDGRPHPRAWQEVRSRHAPQSEFGTLKDLPRCDWHLRFAKDYGEDASLELTRWHLENPMRRPPRDLLGAEHPEAYARVNEQRRRAS